MVLPLPAPALLAARATVAFDDVSRDRQAEAKGAVPPRRLAVTLAEAIEDVDRPCPTAELA
jgi:hypothetical protein